MTKGTTQCSYTVMFNKDDVFIKRRGMTNDSQFVNNHFWYQPFQEKTECAYFVTTQYQIEHQQVWYALIGLCMHHNIAEVLLLKHAENTCFTSPSFEKLLFLVSNVFM